MIQKLLNQKGIGGILIIGAVVFVLIAIAVMAFFLLKGQQQTSTNPDGNGQSQSENTTINDDDVPLKICETGDPEQCNDPVSNQDVDNINNIEDQYP